MAKRKRIKDERILFILERIKSAMFNVLVPSYIEIKYDGLEEDDKGLNSRLLARVGKIISDRVYFDCPECEKILFVGAKSKYPFLHFHEFLKELKRNGA